MTDTIATAPGVAESAGGEASMSRLADRLAALAPPANLHKPPAISMPEGKPAMASGTSGAGNAAGGRRRKRSILGAVVDSFISACSFIPYAVVAIVMRLIMARVIFVDGQSHVDGPAVPINLQGFDLSFLLPLQIKAETYGLFLTKYAALSIPPVAGAYALSWAEFIVPICLLLGFGTRFIALGLLIAVALLQVYVSPEALWSMHVYWAAILLVLLGGGAGQVSLDHVIRWIARR